MSASSKPTARSWARRALWIATTPLALTVLLATPARAQHEGHDHGPGAPTAEHAAAAAAGHVDGTAEHGAAAEGEHHGPPANPIQNLWNHDYRNKDTHGGAYEPEKGDHKMPAPFIWALINFSVLALLIGKYAAPAFRKMVIDRHDTVAKQLEESTRLRDEAQAKLDEYTRKVSSLDAEIAKLVDGIRGEAEHDKKRMIGEAEQRAERMKKEAEQTITAEIARVRAQLEREATLTAIAVAQQLLTEKASDADHRALADKFIQQLAAARGPRPS